MTMAEPTQLIILRSFFEVFVIVAHIIFFSKTNQISRKQILLEIKKKTYGIPDFQCLVNKFTIAP